jgi:acetyl-CoA C-acetyltransferase
MKSVSLMADALRLNRVSVGVAGGIESMSQAPHILRQMRAGVKFGSGVFEDSILVDGLTDAYDKLAMGFFAEKTAKEFGFTREDQDKYCLESYDFAQEA